MIRNRCAPQLPITRRQFGKAAMLLAGAILAGRPWPLRAAPNSNPEPKKLFTILNARISFCPRSAWTRQAPLYSRLDPADAYYRITVHHEGNKANYNRALPDVAGALRLDLAAHRRRGYGDIAYHFMIDYSGRVWEGRSLNYQGAHVSSRNPGNIGLALLGNFELQKPSEAQKAALVKLVAELRQFYGIGRRRVYGHRDLDSTLCPGRQLYKFMPALKSATDHPRGSWT